MNSRIFLSLLCMFSMSGASAAIFKSVDANGKVVYSDRPSDTNIQVGIIHAAVLTPSQSEAPLSSVEGAVRKLSLLDVAPMVKPVPPELAVQGLNARGEVCARVAAENAKQSARTVKAQFSVAPR